MAYSWEDDTGSRSVGMDRSRGADYGSARKAYSPSGGTPRSAGRSAPSAPSAPRPKDCAPAGTTKNPVGLVIKTESTHPGAVVCDDTGSMGEKPKIILEKDALLGKEIERMAPNYAISFALVSDARVDDYGLQVRPFASGPPLDHELSQLGPQFGGGDAPESYGVMAYYYLNHCEIPNAVKPILILILDAEAHDEVRPSEIKKVTGEVIQSPLKTADLFDELSKKFAVYVVLSGRCKSDFVGRRWVEILDDQHVVEMADARDVVEICLGIYSGELGLYDEFEMRSSARHSDKPERVSRVSRSLRSLASKSASMAASASDPDAGKSKVSGSRSGRHDSMRSKKLV